MEKKALKTRKMMILLTMMRTRKIRNPTKMRMETARDRDQDLVQILVMILMLWLRFVRQLLVSFLWFLAIVDILMFWITNNRFLNIFIFY